MAKPSWHKWVILLLGAVPCAAWASDPERNSFLAATGGASTASTALAGQPVTHPLTLTVSVPGFGRVKLLLKTQQARSVTPTITTSEGVYRDEKAVRLFRGRALSRRSDEPAAGALFAVKGRPRLYIGFPAISLRRQSRYYRLALTLDDGARPRAHVQRATRFSPALRAHGDMLFPQPKRPQPLQTRVQTSEAPRLLELNLDADADWYKTYGRDSNAFMTAFVNEAEAIYEKNLGISFRVVRQNVFTGRSFGTRDAENKVVAYQRYTLERAYFGGADVYHLFTGAQLQGNVIGISYVSVACVSPDQSFGLTQLTNTVFVPITFAHELGHTLGARHDDTGVSIMNTILTMPPPRVFSAASIRQIEQYLGLYGHCLDEQRTSGLALPVALSASIDRRGAFEARIDLDAARPECTVTLLGADSETAVLDRGSRLASYSAETASRTFRARLQQRSVRQGKPSPVFLAAAVSCSDGSGGLSAAVRIGSDRVRTKNSTPLSRWLGKLRALL